MWVHSRNGGDQWAVPQVVQPRTLRSGSVAGATENSNNEWHLNLGPCQPGQVRLPTGLHALGGGSTRHEQLQRSECQPGEVFNQRATQLEVPQWSAPWWGHLKPPIFKLSSVWLWWLLLLRMPTYSTLYSTPFSMCCFFVLHAECYLIDSITCYSINHFVLF